MKGPTSAKIIYGKILKFHIVFHLFHPNNVLSISFNPTTIGKFLLYLQIYFHVLRQIQRLNSGLF